MVSLVIMIVVVLGMLEMFDRSVSLNKVQNNVSDVQQSLRYGSYQVVREARMAGAGVVPASTSVGSVRQLGVSIGLGSSKWGAASKFLSNAMNVAGDLVCIGGSCGTSGAHHIRVGTDILHIRGVISNGVYDLGTASWTPPSSGTTGTLIVQPCTKYQSLTAAVTDPCYPNGTNDMSLFTSSSTYPKNKLFVMSDVLGNVGVGLITNVVVPAPSAQGYTATLTIDIGNNATPDTAYSQTLCPNGLFPTGLVSPTRGGVLDDRVYFIDDGTDTATNCNSTTSKTVQDQVPGPCHPQLAYADWATGDASTTPFSTATVTPIADDIEDLQVAYGIDFYDAIANTGTLASPAPTRTVSGQLLSYSSDASLSRTNLSSTSMSTIVTNARSTTSPNLDPSEDTAGVGYDEWVGNVANEVAVGTFDYSSDLSNLKAIEITILAKGSTPDTAGRVSGTSSTPAWIGAFSWALMDNTSATVSQPTSGTAFPYRRRVNTVRAMFRNFSLQ
jgi:hypothetical protein